MSSSDLTLRLELPSDHSAVWRVHAAAFPTPAEAYLVDQLRSADQLTISVVANASGQIVGHIAFSPITLNGEIVGLGLAPLAVLPEFQRQGIGQALVDRGLQECRRKSVGLVVVLGDPAFYGRFGFQPASRWQLRDEYGGGNTFQAIELTPGAFPPGGGLVKYAREFANLPTDA